MNLNQVTLPADDVEGCARFYRAPAGNVICLFHAGGNRRNPPWRIDRGDA